MRPPEVWRIRMLSAAATLSVSAFTSTLKSTLATMRMVSCIIS